MGEGLGEGNFCINTMLENKLDAKEFQSCHKVTKTPRFFFVALCLRGEKSCRRPNLTMDDKKAAIIKILEMAIIEEIKAKNFYFKMSAQLSNNEAKSRFRHMAEAEQEHEDILKAWYEETCGYPFDESKTQSKEYKLDIAEPEQNATFVDIVKLIARVENKAFRFYAAAAHLARTPEEKRMFEKIGLS